MEEMSQNECIGPKEKAWVLNAKNDWPLVGVGDERVLNNKMETLEKQNKTKQKT